MYRSAMCVTLVAAVVALAASGCGSTSHSSTTKNADPGGHLTVLGAGTLANPFAQEFAAFKRHHPGVTIDSNFAGSTDQARKITDLGERADVLGVADYSVIPRILYPAHKASWYVGFAGNEITFAYTGQSKGADKLTASNWYHMLAEPGVRIGRSDPNGDPSGYQLLQMLMLSERHYHDPGLEQAVLANSPSSQTAETETSLIAALQSGQIDYLGIYRSDALQHHFDYLHLPADVNLSDAAQARSYATVSASTSKGAVTGKPIIYALTIPSNAPDAALGREFVEFVLGPEGQAIMKRNGFDTIHPAYASGGAVPAALRSLSQPWPAAG